MSFILDALKKSESERHRQTGPVLMDVRVAPPRRRIPAWAWVIAAVLVVNLGVLAWILWRSPSQNSAAPAAAVPPAAPANAPVPASALPPPTLQQSTVQQSTLPPPALPAATSPTSEWPAQLPSGNAPAPALPAQPPSQSAAGTAAGAQNIDVSALPKVADMIAAGITLPSLQLNWHVYDPAPQSRYVLLNGARLREGESTADGVRVLAIVPTGVVVEWRGRQMLLNAGH